MSNRNNNNRQPQPSSSSNNRNNRTRININSGRKISIIPVEFRNIGEYGDFGWMIKQEEYYKDALFIFNDNGPSHRTYIEGGGNATIRPYNIYNKNPPKNSGISAGISTGGFFNDDGGGQQGSGFTDINDAVTEQLNMELAEIYIILDAYPNINRIYYSANSTKYVDNDNNIKIYNKDVNAKINKKKLVGIHIFAPSDAFLILMTNKIWELENYRNDSNNIKDVNNFNVVVEKLDLQLIKNRKFNVVVEKLDLQLIKNNMISQYLFEIDRELKYYYGDVTALIESLIIVFDKNIANNFKKNADRTNYENNIIHHSIHIKYHAPIIIEENAQKKAGENAQKKAGENPPIITNNINHPLNAVIERYNTEKEIIINNINKQKELLIDNFDTFKKALTPETNADISESITHFTSNMIMHINEIIGNIKMFIVYFIVLLNKDVIEKIKADTKEEVNKIIGDTVEKVKKDYVIIIGAIERELEERKLEKIERELEKRELEKRELEKIKRELEERRKANLVAIAGVKEGVKKLYISVFEEDIIDITKTLIDIHVNITDNSTKTEKKIKEKVDAIKIIAQNTPVAPRVKQNAPIAPVAPRVKQNAKIVLASRSSIPIKLVIINFA